MTSPRSCAQRKQFSIFRSQPLKLAATIMNRRRSKDHQGILCVVEVDHWVRPMTVRHNEYLKTSSFPFHVSHSLCFTTIIPSQGWAAPMVGRKSPGFVLASNLTLPATCQANPGEPTSMPTKPTALGPIGYKKNYAYAPGVGP